MGEQKNPLERHLFFMIYAFEEVSNCRMMNFKGKNDYLGSYLQKDLFGEISCEDSVAKDTEG